MRFFFIDEGNITHEAFYSHFKVLDSSTFYQLDVSSFKANNSYGMEDDFSDVNGGRFVTIENENDPDYAVLKTTRSPGW